MELQVDLYASSLLMPKDLVVLAWSERFGNINARVLKDNNRLVVSEDANDELTFTLRSFDQQRDDEVLNEFVRPFAEKFQVSMVSMRIRLERLGLLLREVPRQRSFSSAL